MLRNASEYSPPRRGAVDALPIKWIRSEIGAAGVVSSAKLFRPEHLAELTTITASRYRASRRSAASLRGGEYPNVEQPHIVDHRSGGRPPARLDPAGAKDPRRDRSRRGLPNDRQ